MFKVVKRYKAAVALMHMSGPAAYYAEESALWLSYAGGMRISKAGYG